MDDELNGSDPCGIRHFIQKPNIKIQNRMKKDWLGWCFQESYL